MNDTPRPVAQLVMKRADGHSILDRSEPATAGSASLGAGDLPDDRVDHIRRMLSDAGLTVEGGNNNTLSVSGPPEVFIDLFGMDPESAGRAGTAAHATKLPPDLEPFVADVFVPPGPTLFP